MRLVDFLGHAVTSKAGLVDCCCGLQFGQKSMQVKVQMSRSVKGVKYSGLHTACCLVWKLFTLGERVTMDLIMQMKNQTSQIGCQVIQTNPLSLYITYSAFSLPIQSTDPIPVLSFSPNIKFVNLDCCGTKKSLPS